MKAIINELYRMPMSKALKEHLLKDIGLSEDDQRILSSLMSFSASSEVHYQHTMMPKEKFERHLRSINNIVLTELVRLSDITINQRNPLP